MPGSFDCRLPPIPARTSSRRRSTWTSPRAPDVTRRGWVLFAAMAVIWGIPYLLIKIAVGELTPVTLVFLRTAVGATLLLPIAAARGGVRPPPPHWRWGAAHTLVQGSLPRFFLSGAEPPLS